MLLLMTVVVPPLLTAVDSASNAVVITPPQLLSDFRAHMRQKTKIKGFFKCFCIVNLFDNFLLNVSDGFIVPVNKMNILDTFVHLTCIFIVFENCAAELSGAGQKNDVHESSDNDQES